jgi:hypothetical protein
MLYIKKSEKKEKVGRTLHNLEKLFNEGIILKRLPNSEKVWD